VVKVLLEHRADPSTQTRRRDTALSVAAQQGCLSVVQLLAVHPENDLEATNKDGETALMCAAIGHHWNVVRYLVSKGASLAVLDNRGKSISQLTSVLHNKKSQEKQVEARWYSKLSAAIQQGIEDRFRSMSDFDWPLSASP